MLAIKYVLLTMVPIDGKGFFAHDVLRAATSSSGMSVVAPGSR